MVTENKFFHVLGASLKMKGLTLSNILVFLLIIAPPSFSAVLTHGPIVGGVTYNKARVFVRTDQESWVKIKYSDNPDFLNAYLTSSYKASLGKDFTVIVPLRNLAPKTTYYYNILIDDTPGLFSDYPSFTTFYPSFTTFPATTTPQPFKFIVLTDFATQTIVKETYQTFLSASEEGADFCFIGGDFDHGNPTTISERRIYT